MRGKERKAEDPRTFFLMSMAMNFLLKFCRIGTMAQFYLRRERQSSRIAPGLLHSSRLRPSVRSSAGPSVRNRKRGNDQRKLSEITRKPRMDRIRMTSSNSTRVQNFSKSLPNSVKMTNSAHRCQQLSTVRTDVNSGVVTCSGPKPALYIDQ